MMCVCICVLSVVIVPFFFLVTMTYYHIDSKCTVNPSSFFSPALVQLVMMVAERRRYERNVLCF